MVPGRAYLSWRRVTLFVIIAIRDQAGQAEPHGGAETLVVSKRTARGLFIGARLIVACTTLVLLTVTILQRQDGDGYQATHLFFMPRNTWEMDQGRAMLYDEEHYHEMDLRAAAAEFPGRHTQATLLSPEERERGGLTDNAPSPSPALHRLPYAPGLAGNQIPLIYGLEALAPDSGRYWTLGEPAPRPTTWKGDIPSPPPRARSFA